MNSGLPMSMCVLAHAQAPAFATLNVLFDDSQRQNTLQADTQVDNKRRLVLHHAQKVSDRESISDTISTHKLQ